MARRKRTLEKAEEIRREAALDPLRDFEGNAAEYFVARSALWLRENIKYVLVFLGVAGASLIALIAYRIWHETYENKSLEAFENLMREPIMERGSGAELLAAQKLDDYAKQFTGDNAQRRALVYRIDFLAQKEKYAEAGDAAAQLADLVDEPELQAFFLLKAGYYFEQDGKYAPAESSFGRAYAALPDEGALKTLALFGQGRALYSMGRKEDGVKAIQTVLEKTATTVGSQDIRLSALAFLLQRRAP